MNHGQKLKTYLKSIGYSQKEILEKTSFSKGKLYTLFKMSKISEQDRDILIADFELENDFFDNELDEVIPNEKKYKSMYYELLEKYNNVLLELAECRKEQVSLITNLSTFSPNEPPEKHKPKLKIK